MAIATRLPFEDYPFRLAGDGHADKFVAFGHEGAGSGLPQPASLPVCQTFVGPGPFLKMM